MKGKINLSKKWRRAFDVGLSTFILIGLSPLFLVTILAITLSSKGPAIFRQERLGINRKPFIMYKFRTMIEEAEKEGPQLAVYNDKRVTKIGRILRKYHVDELPQFWNVLKGEMSVIGPRPEREIYVKEIEKLSPEYTRLFEIKPGITSLGMVRYGYASNIKNLVERSKFDVDYLDKKKASTDVKILLETVKTIIKGKGI